MPGLVLTPADSRAATLENSSSPGSPEAEPTLRRLAQMGVAGLTAWAEGLLRSRMWEKAARSQEWAREQQQLPQPVTP